MARKKVKLAWIVNDNARKASLKKRRAGLLKKVRELTTLCDVSSSVIIYSPNENQPIMWPSFDVLQQQIERFQGISELDRHKKMVNQETYFRDRLNKMQEQLDKFQRRNKEVDMAHLLDQINRGKGLDELNLGEMQGLTWLVEEKMKDIRKRMEYLEQIPSAPAPSQSTLYQHLSLSPQGPVADQTTMIGNGSGNNNMLTRDQWFINMMNKNENHYVGNSTSHIGLPYHLFGSSSINENIRLPTHLFADNYSVADLALRNARGPPINMGISPPVAAAATDMVLPHGSGAGESGFSLVEREMTVLFQSFGGNQNIGCNRSVSGEFGMFGGSNNGTAGDIEDPFDERTLPDNFTP